MHLISAIFFFLVVNLVKLVENHEILPCKLSLTMCFSFVWQLKF